MPDDDKRKQRNAIIKKIRKGEQYKTFHKGRKNKSIQINWPKHEATLSKIFFLPTYLKLNMAFKRTKIYLHLNKIKTNDEQFISRAYSWLWS